MDKKTKFLVSPDYIARKQILDTLNTGLTFLIGLTAGFIGTNVGGGALIIIPALIFLGLPVQNAIATTKVATIGTMSAGLYRFGQSRKINYKIGIPAAIFATVGSCIGALTLVKTPTPLLEKLAGIFLIILAIMIAFNHQAGIEQKVIENRWAKIVGFILYFLIGFWGGFFGGQEVFSTYLLISLFGLDFLSAAGTRKIAGLCIALVALIVYQFNNIIFWHYGIILLIGTTIGSYVGASYGIKKGNKWVKHLFIIVIIASALKLLF